MTSYNTLAEARATAAAIGVSFGSATDDQITAALKRSAMQIDARRYQGRKYDPDQEHAFPRIVGDVPWNGTLSGYYQNAASAATTNILDWDSTNNVAVVPAAICQAEVLQAAFILAGANSERAQAIADGVASQGVGSLSESYRADARVDLVCVEARAILDRAPYRLSGGPLL